MKNASDSESTKSKVDELNQQAWDVRIHDSPRAFKLSEEAVDLARGIGYTKGLAHALRSLGFCYVRLSKNNEGLKFLKESLSLFETLNDLKGQSVTYEYLGIIQRNWGYFGGALTLLFKALELSIQTGFRENEALNHYQIGVTYKHLGNYEKALESFFSSLTILREMKNRLVQSYPINLIGSIYFENEDYDQALNYYQEGLIIRQEFDDELGKAGSLDNIGFTYLKLKDYQQAIDYCTQSLVTSKITDDKRGQASALLHLAKIYKQTGDIGQAFEYCNESLQIRKSSGDRRGEVEILLFLAELHGASSEKNPDKEIFEVLSAALVLAEEIKAVDLLSKTHHYFYDTYKKGSDFKQALKHLELNIDLEEVIHKNTITQKVLNFEISHKAEETKKEADTVALRNRELTQLNEEIREQKINLEEALTELKATQAQLVQQEKLASLGQLTAGIAHEIKNPLNFVTNFSEVSLELVEEVRDEIKEKLSADSQQLTAILDDIEANLRKIHEHGSRADCIVKSMLQHSRGGNGVMEPTPLNPIIKEYVNLAFHGMRAGKEPIAVDIEMLLDESVGDVPLIAEDFSRVILNLCNNAFDAMSDKLTGDGGPGTGK
jgi:two-component system, NtrC family, sensor kinase